MPIYNLDTSTPDSSKLFFGESTGLVRHDLPPIFISTSIQNQDENRWRPKDIPLMQDQVDYKHKLSEGERFIFDSNLQRQMVLDSLTGRGQILALLPIISHSGLETAVVMWGEFEQVHNRAYTWIEENVYPNGDIIKNTILDNDLLKLCASKVSLYYNNLIKFNNMRDLYLDHGITEFKRNDGTIEMYSEYEHKRHTLRCLFAINGLEAIRFQVSFACNFAFMKRGLMVGTGGQLSLIARDENLHIQLSQAIIKYIISTDKDFSQLFVEEREILASIYKDIAIEEKLWVKYIFSKGSIYGLSESILNQWLDYLLYLRLRSHGFDHVKCENPIPWYYGMISQEKQQQALMEYESSNYKKGVLHMTVDTQRFSKFKNKM